MGLDCYLCKVIDIEELNLPKFKILGDLEDSISDDITYFLKSELLGEDATSYSKNFYKKYKNYFVNIKIPHWDLKSWFKEHNLNIDDYECVGAGSGWDEKGEYDEFEFVLKSKLKDSEKITKDNVVKGVIEFVKLDIKKEENENIHETKISEDLSKIIIVDRDNDTVRIKYVDDEIIFAKDLGYQRKGMISEFYDEILTDCWYESSENAKKVEPMNFVLNNDDLDRCKQFAEEGEPILNWKLNSEKEFVWFAY